MWTPLIVSFVVVIITAIVLSVLEKKGKVERKSKAHKTIEVIGCYIPAAIICVNYAYVKTDTFKEAIIVTAGIFLYLTLYILFLQRWKTKKYNYIAFLIVTFCFIIIVIFIMRYMLSGIYLSMLTTQLGALIGSSISNNKYKGRLIITGILVISMIIFMYTKYDETIERNNKVVSACIQYAENKGYDITDDDYINTFGSLNRNEKIRVLIARRESNWDWTNCLEMVYFKGEIIEFSWEE